MGQRSGRDALHRQPVLGDGEPPAIEARRGTVERPPGARGWRPDPTRPIARSACRRGSQSRQAASASQMTIARPVVPRLLDEDCKRGERTGREQERIALAAPPDRETAGPRSRKRREKLAVRGEPLDARAHREHRDERSRDQAGTAIGDAGDEQRDYAYETCPPHGGKRTNGPGVRPEQVERPAVQEEQPCGRSTQTSR